MACRLTFCAARTRSQRLEASQPSSHFSSHVAHPVCWRLAVDGREEWASMQQRPSIMTQACSSQKHVHKWHCSEAPRTSGQTQGGRQHALIVKSRTPEAVSSRVTCFTKASVGMDSSCSSGNSSASIATNTGCCSSSLHISAGHHVIDAAKHLPRTQPATNRLITLAPRYDTRRGQSCFVHDDAAQMRLLRAGWNRLGPKAI